MKILFFSSVISLQTGGPSRWMDQLSLHMNKLGHQVHKMTWEHSRIPAQIQVFDSSTTYIRLKPLINRTPLIGYLYASLITAKTCREYILRNKIDVVHTASVFEGYSVALAKTSGLIHVMTIHGDYVTELNSQLRSRLLRKLLFPAEKYSLSSCDMITFPSAWLYNQLKPHLSNIPSKIIPNGIPALSSNIQDLPGYQKLKGKKVILSFNNLSTSFRRRAIQFLISCAPLILECFPEVHFLVVGGTNNSQEEKNIAWANESSNGLPFTFTGFQSNPEDYMALADIYVHPSFLDNIPLSILEAMVFGKPVVANSVGGIPEIISHGETGLLVDPENPQAFSEAIIYLLNNNEFAVQLGENAKRFALDNFLWDRVAEKFEKLYLDLINGVTSRNQA